MNKDRVFHYFREISDIARGSGFEEKISAYLEEKLKSLGLYTYVDKNLNVSAKKEASKGYEDKNGIIIQGHMDMVCEKSSSSNHDFTKDPIKWVEKGDFLYAENTTLGADDGVALAIGLAIAEDENLLHPQIELLFTTREETTMEGALNLSDKLLKGRYLLNIDSEEEGILTLGSAGGELFEAVFKPEFEDGKKELVKLDFDGFLGGHSGMEINSGRENMIKTISKFIKMYKVKISKICCGTKENAIPRSGYIIAEKTSEIEKYAKEFCKSFEGKKENLNIKISPCPDGNLMDEDFSKRFVDFLLEMPSGVNTKDETGVVSSSNLAVVEFKDGEYKVYDSLRSSDGKILEDMKNNFVSVAEKYGFFYKFSLAYPGWEKKKDSKLEKIANRVYENMTGKKFENIVIHAGLECGAIYEKYPNLEIISFGPDIKGAHTPQEHLSISSTKRVYEFTKKLIEEIAKN